MTKLSEEARAARNEYFRAWREKNKEHCKEYRAKYWERKAAEAEKAKNDGTIVS